ncbi:hypothetical protein IQ22_04675 [Pseudomonas duriflava]|uniref:Uncharacterized protein n=1 Tax=Pseudomonas duriflava TaxID=459528 RepID=A0A562PLW9_9PSED|nr:hypothetical protein [Pseudomonas duriflava]TWI45036.1 hypothetical protein IQ22_04675 [Pseudomonas duriflava]
MPARGSTHYKSKLTEDDVRSIRELYEWRQAEIDRINSVASLRALAEKFDVTPKGIERIVYDQTWRHV